MEQQLKKLVSKAIKGNPKAYGQLMEHYKEYMYRTAYLMARNEDAALDIVGDSILRGFRFISSLKNPDYFRTWITRIVINAANDYFRTNPYTEDLDTISDIYIKENISQEEKLDLYYALEKLQDNYKQVIMLRYFHEMKISEIAYTLQMPEGTVKAYLTRAKNELRHLLKEDHLYE